MSKGSWRRLENRKRMDGAPYWKNLERRKLLEHKRIHISPEDRNNIWRETRDYSDGKCGDILDKCFLR